MSKKQWQVVLAGEGGQGLVFIGALLGEAAIAGGKNASQTASYTIASRGGFIKAEVVVSDDEITYPAVTEADIILALSSGAMNKYSGPLPDGTTLVYDSIQGYETDDPQRLGLPLTQVVREAAAEGKRAALNLVGLGAIVGMTGMVDWEFFRVALEKRFPKAEVVESNWEALQAGADLVKDRPKT